jgi:hypothetical protein
MIQAPDDGSAPLGCEIQPVGGGVKLLKFCTYVPGKVNVIDEEWVFPLTEEEAKMIGTKLATSIEIVDGSKGPIRLLRKDGEGTQT